MNTVNVTVQDSLGFPANRRIGSQPQDILILGGGRTVSLFFNAGGAPAGSPLLQAKLLLFQIPCGPVRASGSGSGQYALYPLLEPIGTYSPLFAAPAIDFGRGVLFSNPRFQSCTEIDVTSIVRAWFDGSLENNGLLLMGLGSAPCVFFAAGRYRVTGMRPTLRLTFAGEGTRVLESASCEVKILTPKPRA